MKRGSAETWRILARSAQDLHPCAVGPTFVLRAAMNHHRAASLVLLLVSSFAGTASAQSPAIVGFNHEVQSVYDRLRPALVQRLHAEAARFVGTEYKEKKVEVTIKGLNRIDLDVGRAPGLTALSRDRIAMRLPVQGTWKIEVEVDVLVKFRAFWAWQYQRFPLTIRIEKLWLEADATFDHTDPTRPRVRRTGDPRYGFDIDLRAKGFFRDVLARIASPFAQHFAKKALKDALKDMAPQLRALEAALPPPIPAEHAPLLADTGAASIVPGVVEGVDRKIRAKHLPHGIIHPLRMDRPVHDESWAQAYGPGGGGNPGNAEPHGDGGDSSAFTAHYLASQAARYAVTGEPAALDNVRLALRALGDCLAIHGDTGLMARVVAPESSFMGRKIASYAHPSRLLRRTIRGETWVGTNGDSGVSRDVFLEGIYGLMAAHDLVSEPGVRAECARIVKLMVRYLVAKDFIVDEDRDPFDGASPRTFPTFWLGVPVQKVTFLLAGQRVDPPSFDRELRRWGPLVELAWLAEWTGTFDLSDYFAYVLSHATYSTYFRLETDAARWQATMRAYLIMRRGVRNHKNALFDAMHLAIVPGDASIYRGPVREALARFVTRPHRKIAPSNLDLSGIQWVTITLPLAHGQGAQVGAQTLTIPSEPLDPELRAPEDDSLWQRSPFKPYPGAGQGDPYLESTGLDLIQPYWIARYNGVPF